MFGSKLRSWMENHIVRPRKKGNKNKNAGTTSNSASTSLATTGTSNGHKGTAPLAGGGFDGTGSTTANAAAAAAPEFSSSAFATIASPARRSEVSPIQCHTTTRSGWHSPQQEHATSPKSDHYLYRHTVRSPPPLETRCKAAVHATNTPPTAKSMPRKSSYTTTAIHPPSAPPSSTAAVDYHNQQLHSSNSGCPQSPFIDGHLDGHHRLHRPSATVNSRPPTVNMSTASRYSSSTTASSTSTSNEQLLAAHESQAIGGGHSSRYDALNNRSHATHANTFATSLGNPHPHQLAAAQNSGSSSMRSTQRDSVESTSSAASASTSHLMHTSTTTNASSISGGGDGAADVTVKMRRKPHQANADSPSTPQSSTNHAAMKKHQTLEHRYGKIMQRNEHGELGFATVATAAAASPFQSPAAQRRSSSTTSTTTSHNQTSDRNAMSSMNNGNEINQAQQQRQSTGNQQPYLNRNHDHDSSAHTSVSSYRSQSRQEQGPTTTTLCDNRQTAIYASNNNALPVAMERQNGRHHHHHINHNQNANANDDDDELEHTRRSATTTAIQVAPANNHHQQQQQHLHNSINNNMGGNAVQQQQQQQRIQQHKSMSTFGNGVIINQHRMSPAPPPRRETLKPHHILQQQQQQQQQMQQQQHQLAARANVPESNRNNMLRTANLGHHRLVSGTGGAGNWTAASAVAANGATNVNAINGSSASTAHHQLAHMINSLSSPESAYSTGYSTDGTSPGATNCTPEYYINMRTGTHYFPRSAAAAAAAAGGDPSRVKFALNKIDEAPAVAPGAPPATAAYNNGQHNTQQQQKYPQRPPQQQQQQQSDGLTLASQRRLESMSCEMARRHFPALVRGPAATSLVVTESAAHMAMTSKNLAAAASAAVPGLSPDVQRRLTIQSYKGMESPSPRQRCRIRTNPWVSALDPAVIVGASKLQATIDMETARSMGGIKTNGEASLEEKNAGAKIISSGSESGSSDTEIEVSKVSQPLVTPGTVRKRRAEVAHKLSAAAGEGTHESDEDATFNEMMGKFDESYCYEKETDILSDSDPTECVSDLDTGQDGGDECETDDPLEIDYIDTASIQEVVETAHINTGSCSYHPVQLNGEDQVNRNRGVQRRGSVASTVAPKTQPLEPEQQLGNQRSSSRRRKRLTRTRKSSRECRDGSGGDGGNLVNGDRSLERQEQQDDRGTRSVGGTPVSLRRNKQNKASKGSLEHKPMRHRANSLTFSDDHTMRRNGSLAMAESEKALIRADLEADVKYKQLIHEAETILVSMKSSTSASPSVRETPVASPARRACSIPTNKRVEMLRQCEADLRREINKAQQKQSESIAIDHFDQPPPSAQHAQENINQLVNKRIEVLKLETAASASTPNSPKSPARFSPRKTHVSNFIHQNTSPTDLMRRKSSPAPDAANPEIGPRSPRLPTANENGRRLLNFPRSPTLTRRRFRSQSPRVACAIDSDSDSSQADSSTVAQSRRPNGGGSRRSAADRRPLVGASEWNGNQNHHHQLKRQGSSAASRRVQSPASSRRQQQRKEEALNPNLQGDRALEASKNTLMSFRSVDMGARLPDSVGYCPQSEPLKRKVYSGSHTLEKLKKTLEQESEIPKQALLEKISQLRRERKAAAAATASRTQTLADAGDQPIGSPYFYRRTADSWDTNHHHEPNECEEGEMLQFQKQQLILSTLADLKRSLEDQSVELCGMNDD